MLKNAIPWVVLSLVAAIGCAQPPVAEIDAASEAMDTAQAAEAPDYAPGAWAEAQAAEAELESELAAQKDAFALTRSYERAKGLAEEARAAAEKAALEAQAGKETARSEAAQAIDDAKTLRTTVDQLLDHAPQGKGSIADLAALRADTKSTEEWLLEAEAAFAAERYIEARAKAESAIQSLNEVKSQIESARQARDGRA